jgi:hypothetical protein
MGPKKGPHIEVLYSMALVDEVLSATLAKCHEQQSVLV